MNEDKTHRDIIRGSQAQSLMRSDLLQEAFAKLEGDYIAAWRVTPARDTDARERLWQAVNIIGKVKDHLRQVADSGKLAQKNLDEMAREQQRKK